MPKVCRKGDEDNKGDRLVTASEVVFANNEGAARVGDRDNKNDKMEEGSEDVFVENEGFVRIGDKDDKNDRQVQGSPDVFANEEIAWVSSCNPNTPNYRSDASAGVFGADESEEMTMNEHIKDTQQQTSECTEGYMARAGNPTGEVAGEGVPEPNTITNIQINVNCDLSVNETMRLREPTAENPAPGVVTWSWNPPVPGLTLNAFTGEITGTIEADGVYETEIRANSIVTILDTKKFVLVAQTCDITDSITINHPLPGAVITSSCNPLRKHPVTGNLRPHRGVDMAYPGGTPANLNRPVLCAADGKVLYAAFSNSFGNWCVVGHKNNSGQQMLVTVYGHLDSLDVSTDDIVSSGDQLGIMGNTGVGTGIHLHFEIRGPNYMTDTQKFQNQSAAVYDPAIYMDGVVSFDAGQIPKAEETGQPIDPGETTPVIVSTTNNNHVTPAKTEIVCSTYETENNPIEEVTDATGGEKNSSQPATSSNDVSACVPAVVPTKAEVIERINAVIDRHPELDEEDRNYILFVAKIESSYSPYAKNPKSSATGLYQFIDSTWAGLGGNPADCSRTDIEESTERMIDFYVSQQLFFYNEYQESGTIAGKVPPLNEHTARYPSLSKIEFCYGLIHHDGSGNAQKGRDRQGVGYVQSRINASIKRS